jgi:hypothetical protein
MGVIVRQNGCSPSHWQRQRRPIVPPQTASHFNFDFYEPLPIQVEISETPLTSDAGLLPLRLTRGSECRANSCSSLTPTPAAASAEGYECLHA